MPTCDYVKGLPMLCFTYKKVHIHYFGFVHGAPPTYIISDKLKKDIDGQIKRSTVIFSEAHNKRDFEKSIGHTFKTKKKWKGLDSNKAIDELIRRKGVKKVMSMLQGIKKASVKAGKQKVAPKKGLIDRALQGDYKALELLQTQGKLYRRQTALWDKLRELVWVETILKVLYEHRNRKAIFFIMGGVAHKTIMDYLNNTAKFEKQFKKYYGLMAFKSHEMSEIMA